MLAVVALLIRLAIFSRSLAALDKLFVPDDTYYTLAIARSLAHGMGPATSGSTLTSGFQPLLAFLLAPFYALGLGSDAVLRTDLLLLLVADTATVFVIGMIAYRLAGRVAALTAAAVWALSPAAITVSFAGLESSLAVLCAALLLATWMWAGDKPSNAGRRVIVGCVAGLAILARIDLVLLFGLLLAAESWWGSWRNAMRTAGAAVVVIAPWWLWCAFEFGSPIPSSGAAAHRLAPVGAFSSASQGVVAGTVLSGPLQSWDWLRHILFTNAVPGVVCFWAIALVLIVSGGRSWRRCATSRSLDRSIPSAAFIGVLLLFSAGLMIFYAWFAVVWYFSRYLLPVAFVLTIVLGLAAARIPIRAAWLLLPTLVVVAGVALFGDGLLMTERTVQQRPFVAATGYRSAARLALALVPKGARVGAWQSGALSYYAGNRVTVVNLDGVVNSHAPNPQNWAATARYLERQRVRWLADWPQTIYGFALHGRSAMRPERKLVEVATFSQGSEARLALFRIDIEERDGR